MGSKALPIRLIKFLIIHLHSTGIPPPPHFLSISHPFALRLPLSFCLSLSLALSFSLVARADPCNIFLNYIFNGRNK